MWAVWAVSVSSLVEAAISGLLIIYQNIKYAILIFVMLNNNSCIVKVNDAKQDKDDLLSFMRSAAQPSAHCPISKELGDFLQSKASSVQSLPDYPLIMLLWNAVCTNKMILLALRCKTTDKLFDKMVFLKWTSYIFVNTAVTLWQFKWFDWFGTTCFTAL